MLVSLHTAIPAAALALCGLAGPVCAQATGPAPKEPPVEVEAEAAGEGQVEAIGRLITVWNFVKYHHPQARSGRLAMDPEFFELFPKIRAAASVNEADRVLADWVMQTGFGAPCDPCAGAADRGDIALASPVPQWLARLPEGLQRPLKRMYDNRGAEEANFLVHNRPDSDGKGPVDFTNEPDYRQVWDDHDEALWALALARSWGALQYWFPYRDIMDESPEALLPGAVARVLAAQTPDDYQNAITRFVAGAQDSHVGIGQFYGAFFRKDARCTIPYSLRYIEGQLVVDGRQTMPQGPLQAGDALLAIDGRPVAEIAGRIRPYIAASNEDALGRNLMSEVRLGPCTVREVEVQRGEARLTLGVEWQDYRQHSINSFAPHYQPGETIETLPGNVTYVRYQQLKKADLERLREQANASAGLVLDMRGYVSDNIVPDLAGLLIDEPVDMARSSRPSPATPGEFVWNDPVALSPRPDGQRITVRVVALIDHSAQSASEYATMAWRAAGVKVFGSRSAGADGDVTRAPLPSGAQLSFSGLGIFYPDKRPTQRIGIVPDVEVRPTVAGIREGRDEVLERALEYLAAQGQP